MKELPNKTAIIQSKVHVNPKYQHSKNKNRTVTRVRFYKIHNLLLSVACSSGADI